MNLRGWSCLNRASPHVLTGRSHEWPGEFTQMSAPDERPSPIALKSYRRWHLAKLDKGLDEANAKGWTVVSMKNDWKQIFAFEKN